MPLVTPQGELAFKTKFKSLPYGYDKPGKGANNGTLGQPFVVKDHTKVKTEDLSKTGGPDWLVRGGLLAPVRSVQDASRLFQLFTQTPVGSFFTIKQNLLSRVGTDMDGGYTTFTAGIEIPSTLKLLGGPLNQGIYTPLSTLGQALVNAGGIHLYKQGINPFTGGPKYLTMLAPLGNVKQGLREVKVNESGKVQFSNNRLVNLYQSKITSRNGSNDTILFTYKGGPGSVLGIGETKIKTASQRTLFSGIGTKGAIQYATFNPSQIENADYVGDQGSTLVKDFRKELQSEDTNSFISDSPDYRTKNIEQRLNQGNPGARTADRKDYSKGRPDNERGMDQINSLYLYKSSAVTTDKRKNDIVKFRIATIDNDDPSQKVFAHFRAFINSFTDSMNAQWNDFRYIGRGENFYNYQGFTNTINMSFTVVAQSIQELSIMYQKLNYLKSTLAPDYSTEGYMRGSIHQLTLGGYFYETPGIINSLTYTIPNDTTWEIGIPANNQEIEAEGGITFRNPEVKELPHRIEVSMDFKPIFKFLPEKVKDINGAGNITQRFISLEDNLGGNNLYQKTPSNLFRADDHYIVEKQAATTISPRTLQTPPRVQRLAPIFDSQGNRIN
jgi:hypothetical protein